MAGILLVIWVIVMIMTVLKVKYVMCGFSSIKQIAINGDVSDPKVNFAGLNGLIYLVDRYSKIMDNISSFGLNIQANIINTQGLTAKSTSVKNTYTATPLVKSDYTYDGWDGTTKVIPGSVVEFVDNLRSGPLKVEVDTYTATLDELGIFG